MDEFKIESGIPFPGGSRNGRGKWLDLLDKMRDGDSVWVDSLQDARSLQQAAMGRGIVAKIRKDRSGYRVWRIRKDHSYWDRRNAIANGEMPE